jgi:hypothetical protein
MEGDSKRNGRVQAPAIKSNARKIDVPPRRKRFLGVKTAEESMGLSSTCIATLKFCSLARRDYLKRVFYTPKMPF